MEPFKMRLHELITIGCIVVSVTTAYVLLSADVSAIKDNIVDLKISLDSVQKEQYRVNYILGIKDTWEMTTEEKIQLQKELSKKPWRIGR